MRLISFSMTTPQFIAKTKDVTRRNGWWNTVDGQELMGCEKCMGLGPGGRAVRLHPIRLVKPINEKLRVMLDCPAYGEQECEREGFPDWTPKQYVEFFCDSHKGMTPDSIVRRMEFVHLEMPA